MKRCRKALSPVVASIILIAVTVAVSIAVAAWMGALTFNFMATEQGQIVNLTFYAGAPGAIMVNFNNTGTAAITLTEVWVNSIQQNSFTGLTVPQAVQGNQGLQFYINMTVSTGYQYQVMLVSSKGNKFSSTGTAPT